MVLASTISLFVGYFFCAVLLLLPGERRLSGPSEKELEVICDEDFTNYIDEYLQNGAEKSENLHKRKLRIRMSDSILALFILISRYFVK